MGVAIRVSEYLDSLGIPFETIHHNHSQSAMQSAISAGVPAKQTAKGVMLEDHEGKRMLAVVPATNRVMLNKLGEHLGREFHLISETNLRTTFDDCEVGALPAMGDPYHIQSVFDDELTEQNEVFIEAGDHENLLRLTHESFMALVGDHRHTRFSIDRSIDYGQPRRAWDWQ